jgi:hypothetical protein
MNRGAVILSAGVGAGLMYLFDPERGRRRRATLRDQAVHLTHVAADTVGDRSRHLRNRGVGLLAETRSQLSGGHEPPLHAVRQGGRAPLEGLMTDDTSPAVHHLVRVPSGSAMLEGNLTVPTSAAGVVLFAHGSGSSRHSPRNRFVAQMLNQGGLGTLLLDLLTPDEEQADARTAHLRFDIGMLAERLVAATAWLTQHPDTRHLRVGYFGASTGPLRSTPPLWARSSRAGGAPTWLTRRCPGSKRLRSSSSGVTITPLSR